MTSRYWTSPDCKRTIDLDAVVETEATTNGIGYVLSGAPNCRHGITGEESTTSFLAALRAWRGQQENSGAAGRVQDYGPACGTSPAAPSTDDPVEVVRNVLCAVRHVLYDLPTGWVHEDIGRALDALDRIAEERRWRPRSEAPDDKADVEVLLEDGTVSTDIHPFEAEVIAWRPLPDDDVYEHFLRLAKERA